jgi:hypothetical protein
MVLTVFKNFTWMSKNGVNLKNMGHRKDGVFALYSFVSPSSSKNEMVGQGRLELPTSRLSVVRSNQLSYKPVRNWWRLTDSNR